VNFLKSNDPEDQRLKFYLTQGYYFIQLIDVDGLQFNPLNEQAFSGAVFYLDTNVLLLRFQSADERMPLFDEMVSVAKRLGIDLRVSRATINEARRVGHNMYAEMMKILPHYPIELLERSNDWFLQSYLRDLEKNPSLTPEQFIEPFDRLAEVCEQEIGLEVDDRDEGQIISGRDFLRVSQIMQEEAKAIRGSEKSDHVLEHDVCHYALVQDERQTNTKTWFLTLDRSLSSVALRLREAQPFCYSLFGLVQSISPFLSIEQEERSFAEVFCGLLSEHIFPIENTFEMKDLRLFYEYHSDLVSLPPNELVLAWDYLSQVVLKGEHYKPAEAPKVALELRKFISASADEQRLMLTADKERLERERDFFAGEKERLERERHTLEDSAQTANAAAESERRARLETETERNQFKGEVEALQRELSSRIDQSNQQLDVQRQVRRRDYMIVGFSLGAVVWVFGSSLISVVNRRWAGLEEWRNAEETIIRTLGGFVFSWPALPFIKNLRWATEWRLALFGAVVVVALAFSRLPDNSFFSGMSSLVSIAMLIATLVFYSVLKKE
jgi:hypothetical protein